MSQKSIDEPGRTQERIVIQKLAHLKTFLSNKYFFHQLQIILHNYILSMLYKLCSIYFYTKFY